MKKNVEEINKRNSFFLSIWQRRAHRSEVSGDKIYGEILTVYFHHILPKKQFPQAEYDEENIILLTWNEHDQVGMDMYYYEEINKRREKLKIKYNL